MNFLHVKANLSEKSKRTIAIVIALLSVYIIWGSTYLGIKIAIETFPPFLMAGIRFLIAGILLYGFVFYKEGVHPKLIEWRDTTIIGTLLLLGGNGLVVIAERSIPSSIAAIIIATVPLWMIVMGWLMKIQSKPNISTLFGTLIGFLGVAILMYPSHQENLHFDTGGLLFTLLAAILWSLGSIYSQKAILPSSTMLSTAMQMVTGGAVLVIVGTLTGEWQHLDPEAFSSRSLMAVLYLIFIGSLLGFSAYVWLLKNVSPYLASTYAFVNPIVALFLGYFFADEVMSIKSLIATVLIISAVVMITLFKAKGRSKR
ncbi:drug/metabolite exporter YedA [Sulfurospirillum diekertiae]|uniref:Inner membrane transporter YedA n=1 Tax=Sulfurospirillum diekertiae TaxID=1854492 RepID=A0A1Y0HJP7_9BACT|nr:drug/metabolite exporter YedA [Sulfurospirillum diekertiae]ARU47624.1 putative inner membrane transporter YedA [Sulfurospirillum diekertiae]ASC92470.1 putative inner membrane transporter YedA [Sulfurospirillum diekertiae]